MMKDIKKAIIPVILASSWIALSEFLRNEIIFKDYWTEHYDSLSLIFPSEPINGIVWIVWSLLLAVIIYVLLRDISLFKTISIVWIMAFVMMWLVIGNLSVLPTQLLVFAIPLSLIEVFIAAKIIQFFSK